MRSLATFSMRRKAHAKLRVEQLADRADALVLEVVDVVGRELHPGLVARIRRGRFVHSGDVLDDGNEVVLGDVSHRERERHAQLFVELVATDLGEIVAARVEEHRLHQRSRRVGRRRVARTDLVIDVEERGLAIDDLRVFVLERRRDVAVYIENFDRRKIQLRELRCRELVDLGERGNEELIAVAQIVNGELPGQIALGRTFDRDALAELLQDLLVAFEFDALDVDLGLEAADRVLAAVGLHHDAEIVVGDDVARLEEDLARARIDERRGEFLTGELAEVDRELAFGRGDGERMEGAQKRRDRELLVLADPNRDGFRRVGLDIDPGTFRRDERREELPLQGERELIAEVDARRSGELADHDALRAVDHERSLLRHQGQIAQIDFGLFELAAGHGQPDGRFDGNLEGDVARPALLQRVLRFAKGKIDEFNGRLARKIIDGRERLEQLVEPVFEEPSKGV